MVLDTGSGGSLVRQGFGPKKTLLPKKKRKDSLAAVQALQAQAPKKTTRR